ncbi:hypothetical protein Y027_5375 [Burkholderia pseudomallei TSV5]|nr:hypothetical protein Y027_5375 [Burkholderia pseudomallei TSV5]
MYAGAGELTDHSRPAAPHGSALARAPRFMLHSAWPTNISTPAPSTNEPRLVTRFVVSHPMPGGYV